MLNKTLQSKRIIFEMDMNKRNSKYWLDGIEEEEEEKVEE